MRKIDADQLADDGSRESMLSDVRRDSLWQLHIVPALLSGPGLRGLCRVWWTELAQMCSGLGAVQKVETV